MKLTDAFPVRVTQKCLPSLSQEEKRKMKEEIERRRAEAAEKRQKVDDTMDGEGKPFKCLSPRGSSLKVCPTIFDFSPQVFHSDTVHMG